MSSPQFKILFFRFSLPDLIPTFGKTPKTANHSTIFCLLPMFFLLLAMATASASDQGDFRTAPIDHQGKKWRIGYLEGGNYNDYIPVLKSTLSFLAKMGWLENADNECLKQASKTRDIWNCLSADQSNHFLEFVSDAYWSADWNEEKRSKNKADFLNRANRVKDIDLMIAMGTWAGQDLANNDHGVPTIVLSTSNAYASGIIKSPEDSGFDHVHARVDPTRYARQVRLFHEIVKFKKMGMVLEDTVEGRSYSGLDQIETVAKERGFEIIKCHASFSGVDLTAAEKAVVDCHQELAPKIDAMYITIHRGVTERNMARLLAPLFKHKIPNFTMGTLYEVHYGAMMSMAQPNFDYAGKFYAQTIAKIFNGAKPRNISQILEDPQVICVNLLAASLVGFDFPMDILSGADQILKTIEEYKDPQQRKP
ncbi:MAG: ABC transporter substrate-binding protein [Deltaproteobacteria bacterium]|nr:ABC transporter substrate-binding protein [Deltaproteobacteria bacterium]